jgi:ABC-type transporter Mla subunit MlaD
MSGVLQKSRLEADHESFTLDSNGDTARRVTDAEIHSQLEVVKTKLDDVVSAIENITINVGAVTVSNEVEIKNDIGNPAPVSVIDSALPVGAATEATLTSVLSAVDQLEGYLDSVESLLTSIGGNTDGIEGLLTTIRDNADTVESLLTSVNSNVDGLETLAAAANALLTTISSNTDTLEALIASTNTKLDTANGLLTTIRDNADTVETLLTNIGSNTDGIEALITSTNGLLTTIRDNADTVEALLTSIGSNTDGIEGLITSSNALLTTIRDNADTVESLLSTINGNVDGLEGLVTSTNALLTTIRDNADTVEALIASSNVYLNSIDLKVSTAANQTTELTRIGDLTEAAPGTDTASSGLNGRLQRIAQRVTSLITSTTDRSQKTQITNGAIDSAVSASTPSLSDAGLVTRPLPYEPQTYSAAASNATFPLLATDVWNIIGSATKTIRITKIRLTGTTTSGSPITVSAALIKRSALNTGGTRTVLTNVPHDNTNAAGTANVGFYTVNPLTLGAAVGNVRAHRITFNNTGITGGDVILDFVTGQPLILRGASQQLCINFNATTVTGNIISVSVEWQEV